MDFKFWRTELHYQKISFTVVPYIWIKIMRFRKNILLTGSNIVSKTDDAWSTWL